MKQGDVETTNLVVKNALAAGVSMTGPNQVLEWGCGYHSMVDLFPGVGRCTWVDLDPAVVRWQRSNSCKDSKPVFHFRITNSHIRTMRRLLKPNGYVLANVYKRNGQSREHLRRAFEKLEMRQEFWFIERADAPRSTKASLVLSAVDRELKSYLC